MDESSSVTSRCDICATESIVTGYTRWSTCLSHSHPSLSLSVLSMSTSAEIDGLKVGVTGSSISTAAYVQKRTYIGHSSNSGSTIEGTQCLWAGSSPWIIALIGRYMLPMFQGAILIHRIRFCEHCSYFCRTRAQICTGLHPVIINIVEIARSQSCRYRSLSSHCRPTGSCCEDLCNVCVTPHSFWVSMKFLVLWRFKITAHKPLKYQGNESKNSQTKVLTVSLRNAYWIGIMVWNHLNVNG